MLEGKVDIARRHRRLALERVEDRRLLTTLPFSEALSLGPEQRTERVRDVWLTDLNMDGHLDILTNRTTYDAEPGLQFMEINSAYLSWYLNDGAGAFEAVQRESQDETHPIMHVSAWIVDVDGDGDKDVVRQNESGYVLAENRFADGGTFHTIADSRFQLDATIMEVADLNGDGKDDLVTSAGWAQNVNGQFAEHKLDGMSRHDQVLVLDIDGDSDLDLVSKTGQSHVTVRENVGGENVFADPHVIEIDLSDRIDPSIIAFDVDRDGDQDLVLWDGTLLFENNEVSRGGFFLLENQSGDFVPMGDRRFAGTTGPLLISPFMQLDVTGDGHLEQIFREQGGAYGYVHDLMESPWVPLELPEFATGTTGDIDADGDTDWLGANLDGDLSWFATGEYAMPEQVIDIGFPNLQHLTATDFDGDGDVDVTYTRGSNLYWFENLGSNETLFAKEQVLLRLSGSPLSLLVTDITGDGLPDVAYSAPDEAGISANSWHANLGYSLGERVPLPSGTGLAFLDLDANGFPDLHLSGHEVWLNNGDGEFTTKVDVPWNVVATADVDQDGRQDLVMSQFERVSWVRNQGDNTFGAARTIATGESEESIHHIVVFDADGDGDPDVVVMRRPALDRSGNQPNEVFENQDGQFVLTSEFNGSSSLPFGRIAVEDLDQDGDLDLLGLGDQGHDYFENLGDLTFATSQRLPHTPGSPGTRLFGLSDFDGDGLIDFAAAFGDQVYWNRQLPNAPIITSVDLDRVFAAIRNGDDDPSNDWNGDTVIDEADVHFILDALGTRQGDVNLDGSVDFRDFLILSRNFGQQDANWSDGDMDGDGEIAFGDFLLLSTAFGIGDQ